MLLPVLFPDIRSAVRHLAFGALAFGYLPLLLGHAVLIVDDLTGGAGILFATGVAVAFSDIGAYVTGRTFGRHPLAPTISPNKTVEGLAGNLVGAVIGYAIFLPVLPTLSRRPAGRPAVRRRARRGLGRPVRVGPEARVRHEGHRDVAAGLRRPPRPDRLADPRGPPRLLPVPGRRDCSSHERGTDPGRAAGPRVAPRADRRNPDRARRSRGRARSRRPGLRDAAGPPARALDLSRPRTAQPAGGADARRARASGPGSRVATWAANDPWLVAAYFAVWRLGGSVVPLDLRMAPDVAIRIGRSGPAGPHPGRRRGQR